MEERHTIVLGYVSNANMQAKFVKPHEEERRHSNTIEDQFVATSGRHVVLQPNRCNDLNDDVVAAPDFVFAGFEVTVTLVCRSCFSQVAFGNLVEPCRDIINVIE